MRPRLLMSCALVLLSVQLVATAATAGTLACAADEVVRASCCCPQDGDGEPAREARLSRSCCCEVEAPGPAHEAPPAVDRSPTPATAEPALPAGAPFVLATPPLVARPGPTDGQAPPGPSPVLRCHAFLC